MTVNGMIASFLAYYDRITSFSAPGYLTDEILLFLNSAQDDFIKDRMFGQNFQPPAFEDNQKRVADLRTLVTLSTALTYTSNDINGARQYTIPSNFMFAIKANATCTRTNYPLISSAENFGCRFIKTEEFEKLFNTTYNKTHFLRPFTTISGTVLKIMGDRFTTITNVYLQYLRVPSALVEDGTCDLPAHTHQEIVDISVRQALQAIQDPRWQSQVQEEKLKTS